MSSRKSSTSLICLNTASIKKSKPLGELGHQRMTVLDNGDRLIFRKDVGEFAHSIGKKYPNPVDHYNIDIQKQYIKKSGKFGHENFYKMHIIIDETGDYVDHFGKYVGKYTKYNK